MRVVGIDPSLACTAVAVVEPGLWEVHSLPTKSVGNSIDERLERIELIAEFVDQKATPYLNDGPDLILIEGPALGTPRQAGTWDRAGLWWNIVTRLSVVMRADGTLTPVIEVPPATLKMFVTGTGNAGKDRMILDAVRRYGDAFPAESNDETDALCLAFLGAYALGYPQELTPLPKTHARALDKLTLPDGVA